MNIHELRPPPGMQQRDPRLDRCKIMPVPMALLIQLLNAEAGDRVPRVEGWPTAEDEAVILSMNLTTHPQMGVIVVFVLHSPKFPLVLQDPPIMPLTGSWRLLPEGVTWDDLRDMPLPDEAADAAPA